MIAASRWTDVALGTALGAILLSTSFQAGWSQVETDFPNYYTAAVEVRNRLPLKRFYDWTWFQREMNYTGTERQLGAYTPQSPLALLPFLPLSVLAPQNAKRVWLSGNIALLACSIWLLASVSALPYRWIFLIFLAGYGSLHANFVLGQYYVFLTFLLAFSAWSFFRGREVSAGAALGTMFALKLYSAPFALFFLVKRRWAAVAALIFTAAAFALISVAMFGWRANWYYVESVLPSVMSGMLIDPYNVGHGSMCALLRRTFVPEPELNPHPMIAWPAAFAFLQTAFSVGVLGLTVLVLFRREKLSRREFAWLVIALLLLAPVNATYVFTLLAVPAALLLPEYRTFGRILLLAGLAVVGAPLPRGVLAFFPRVGILAALFVLAGWPGLRSLSIKPVGVLAVIVAIVASIAGLRTPSPQPFERLVQPGYSIAAMSPAQSSQGPIYQSFGDGRYVLRTSSKAYTFEGHAFHPAASVKGGPVLFELVSRGHSSIMSLDLESGNATALAGAAMDPRDPAISPDGQRAAFTSRGVVWVRDSSGLRSLDVRGSDPSFSADGSRILFANERGILAIAIDSGPVERPVPVDGSEGGERAHPVMSPDGSRLAYSGENRGRRQIWWRTLPAGPTIQLTSADCNSDSPVWEADSRHMIFTSDCGRGLGLPGLYRAEVIERPRRR